ncbi:MAG TPA: rhomboid family intramembrane serine protease [Pirellulales bacterium]|jgi:membrane associated rhomboid family serine protease|nr:rhomboid family intramembrane serine protease [Pirellulales bacterium]
MLFPLRDDNPATRTPFATFLLIAVNVLVMLWLSQQPPLEERRIVVEHGFIPVRIEQLSNPKLVVDVPLTPAAERPDRPRFVRQQQPREIVRLAPAPLEILLTILTTMFLHGGWMHVAGNMWFLWIFGNNVEDRLGPALYLGFYLVGGVLATSCHWAYDPHSTVPVIGASGAVATILGAYAVAFPQAKVKTLVFFGLFTIIDIPALVWLGLWLGGELLSAVFVGKDLTVAVWAHIGGFAAGAMLMPILTFGTSPHGTSWEDEIKRHFSFPPPDGR